ncbi:MAG: hypothetical protein AAFV07_15005 [Bacteroidota bacterium]
MATELYFPKTGKEIKRAITNRLKSLESRLIRRNVELDELLGDPARVRSYILRNTQYNYSHGSRFHSGGTLYGKNHISSEEVEEINQLCRRVMEIDQEMGRLKLVVKHLGDDQIFNLTFEDLTGYGFDLD